MVMKILSFILIIVFSVVFIVGLIKPTYAIFWGEKEKRTKRKVSLVYSLLIMISCFFLVIFSNNEEANERKTLITKEEENSLIAVKKIANDVFVRPTVKSEGKKNNAFIQITIDSKDDDPIEVMPFASQIFELAQKLYEKNDKINDTFTHYDIKLLSNDEEIYQTTLHNEDLKHFWEAEIKLIQSNETTIVSKKDIKAYKTEKHRIIQEEKEKELEKQKEEEWLAKKIKEVEKQEEEERKRMELQQQIDKMIDEEAYNTGINYEDIARDKDGLISELVTLSGKILQVMPSEKFTQYRMAVDGNYDQMVLLEINNKDLDVNILEDDYITVYGMSRGNIEYQTVFGANKTAPAISVHKFELN